MTRSKQISAYVEPDTRLELEKRAEEEGISVSKLVTQYVNKGLRDDSSEDIIEDDAKQEIKNLIRDELDDHKHEIRQTRDVAAKSGCYNIVGFQLLAQSHNWGSAQISEEFKRASSTLHDDIDAEEIAESAGTDPEPDHDTATTDKSDTGGVM